MSERTCVTCGVTKPETPEFFYRSPTCRGGLTPACKDCKKAQVSAYRRANPEKIKAQSAAHSIRHKDAIRARARANYARASESEKERRRRYAKVWNASPYGRLSSIIARLRIRSERLGLLADFTAADWYRCLEFFGNACAYCGATEKLTQDHVVATVVGGPYTAANIVVACESCNKSKGHWDMPPWFRSRPYFAEARLARITGYIEEVVTSCPSPLPE